MAGKVIDLKVKLADLKREFKALQFQKMKDTLATVITADFGITITQNKKKLRPTKAPK